jgi:hypothetical protein
MNVPELEFRFLNKIDRLIFSMDKNLLNKEMVKIQTYSTVRKISICDDADDKIPVSFDSDKNKANCS